MVGLLDEVVVGGGHVSMTDYVLHELRLVLRKQYLIALFKQLQHVVVQALVQHHFLKVLVLNVVQVHLAR